MGDLNAISQAVNGCSIEKCAFTHRHNQVEEDNNLSDTTLNFWAQALDAAHFQIFHLFEAGMRSIDNEKDEQKLKSDNDSFFLSSSSASSSRRGKRTKRKHKRKRKR